jgi:hypothetical protein
VVVWHYPGVVRRWIGGGPGVAWWWFEVARWWSKDDSMVVQGWLSDSPR